MVMGSEEDFDCCCAEMSYLMVKIFQQAFHDGTDLSDF